MTCRDDLHILLRHRLLRQPYGFEGVFPFSGVARELEICLVSSLNLNALSAVVGHFVPPSLYRVIEIINLATRFCFHVDDPPSTCNRNSGLMPAMSLLPFCEGPCLPSK